MLDRLRSNAHALLGAIRLFNGAVALVAPQAMCRRLGIDPAANPSAIYPLRMFGIRTVLLGLELLVGRRDRRRQRLDLAVVVHASDTLSAAAAGIRRHVPMRVGVLITAISAANTALALVARRPPERPARRVAQRWLTWRVARRLPWRRAAALVPVVRLAQRLR
jgi:hypothetical protein